MLRKNKILLIFIIWIIMYIFGYIFFSISIFNVVFAEEVSADYLHFLFSDEYELFVLRGDLAFAELNLELSNSWLEKLEVQNNPDLYKFFKDTQLESSAEVKLLKSKILVLELKKAKALGDYSKLGYVSIFDR